MRWVRKWWPLLLVLASGVMLRLLVRLTGHGSDVEAWQLAADIMRRGGVVYAETERYNYGPVWFTVLDGLRWLTEGLPHPGVAFRVSITLFLIAVDILIFLVLCRHVSLRVAALFFLSPLSIVVTAYLGQFDNLALLIGFVAVVLLTNDDASRLGPRKAAALVLLGMSLATKHVLFMLPLWLALKERRWVPKLAALSIPVAIFLLAFVPYWEQGKTGVVRNVFLYGSSGIAPFWDYLVPRITHVLPERALFFLTLAALGVVFRKKGPVETFFIYTGSIFLFSSGWYAHYMAIPAWFIAAHMNPFLALFTLVVGWDFAGRFLGLIPPGALQPSQSLRIPVEIVLLFAGYLWAFQRRNIRTGVAAAWRWLTTELAAQFPRGQG